MDDIAAGKSTLKDAAKKVERPKTERLPTYRPCDGMRFATMAIAQLERIDPRDTQRVAALLKVKTWTESQLDKK